MKFHAATVLALLSGCATARLAGEPVFCPPDRGEQRAVVLEPFFETADWTTTVTTETLARAMGSSPGFGVGLGGVIQRSVTDKPVCARIASLAAEHREVLAALQRLRPSWRVTSTGGVGAISGPVTLVRVIVGNRELLESDRELKNLAFGFGLVIWPLELINISPVHETLRVYGVLNRFDVEAPALTARLVRYPSQPDFAVNTSNLPAIERRYGLDVSYTEGLLANEAPRDLVLLEGFSMRLAAAIVALVEES